MTPVTDNTAPRADASTPAPDRTPLVVAEGITVQYGGVRALEDVSLTVGRGERLGLIGPNGAGKTTFFNVLTGFAPVAAGRLTLEGDEITQWSPQRRFSAGLSRTFQIPEVVSEASVLDNVLLGSARGSSTSLFDQALRTPRYRRREREATDRAMTMLERVGLVAVAHRQAGQLPLGQVRLLELARCLMSEPKVLLLDELASGLTDDELEPIENALEQARSTGQTVVLVEHNVSWIMRLVDRVHVLDQGHTLTSGTPEVVRRDERVIEAYLGAHHDRTA
jgi:branched-chain amino acid transport system ATP-binding protein